MCSVCSPLALEDLTESAYGTVWETASSAQAALLGNVSDKYQKQRSGNEAARQLGRRRAGGHTARAERERPVRPLTGPFRPARRPARRPGSSFNGLPRWAPSPRRDYSGARPGRAWLSGPGPGGQRPGAGRARTPSGRGADAYTAHTRRARPGPRRALRARVRPAGRAGKRPAGGGLRPGAPGPPPARAHRGGIARNRRAGKQGAAGGAAPTCR